MRDSFAVHSLAFPAPHGKVSGMFGSGMKMRLQDSKLES